MEKVVSSDFFGLPKMQILNEKEGYFVTSGILSVLVTTF
jgi:hypothetical protein